MPLPQRKSPRLSGYDYASEGVYFVTICTFQREHIFGQVVNDGMVLSNAGRVASERWLALCDHHDNVVLDAFVIMPNHMHGILWINTRNVGTRPASSERNQQQDNIQTMSKAKIADNAGVVPTKKLAALGTIIGSYKSSVTRHIRQSILEYQHDVIWQKRYHDHIIRDEADYARIVEYVLNNPARWAEDSLNS